MLAVVMAAWRSVHGAETIDQAFSLYYVANEIAQTSHGMMMAIPEDEWRVFDVSTIIRSSRQFFLQSCSMINLL
jgi:hypothetical protein